jgi:hypothetical protein
VTYQPIANMGDSASDPMDLDNLAAAPDVAAAALKPASWCLPKPKLLPKTHEPAMIGYEFKQDGVTRKIQLKTANKRAKTSWIWRHGFECRRKGPGPHPQKPDWLCGICWDRGKIEVSNTGSTTPAIQYLNEAHDLNADGVIVRSKPIVNALQNTARDDTEAEPVLLIRTVLTASFVVGIVKPVQRRNLFISSVWKQNTDYTDY